MIRNCGYRIEAAGDEFVNISNQEFFIGKAWSVTTLLKEINQALNENNPDDYTIPQNKPLVAQEFLLIENSGSDDLEDFVDSQFSKARLTLKVPFVDGILFEPVEEEITAYMNKLPRRKRPGSFIILCNTMIICPDAVFADNEDNLNDILDGFEEDTAMTDEDMDVLNGCPQWI